MAVQDIWLLPLPDMPFEQLLAREGHVMIESERAQLTSKRLPKGRHMYAFTRIALRHVLSRYETHVAPGQWRFARQGAGKPAIAAPDSTLYFNLTHADDMLVIAVCDHAEVGVDVEDSKREVDVMALSRRYYQPNEVRRLERETDPERQRSHFLTLWTLKEAAVKATGKGLSQALRDFSFTLLPPDRIEARQERAGGEAASGKPSMPPAFWSFAWRDYLVSAAKLSASPLASERQSDTGWRCFCWEWPDIHPLTQSPTLLWKTTD